MNYSSLPKIISNLELSQVVSYLANNNWIEDGAIGDVATIWHRPDSEDSDLEILLPNNANLRDYVERIRDALFTISELENRNIEDIIPEIVSYFSDIIKIRIIHDDVENGTIPLEDGVLLIDKTRELLTSAALSTLNKKKIFSGSRPQDVNNFIEKARLGQTEIGSYIVNVIAPIEPPDDDLFNKSSFSRLVTSNLSKSLTAVSDIVNNLKSNEGESIIDESIEDGVSANLCDALVGLSGGNKSRDFNISIAFSQSEPCDPELIVNHLFSADSIPYIERTSEYLKENYVISGVIISGVVKKLDRSPNEDSGTVTVFAFVEGKERNVSFELPVKEYLKAINAHENKHTIECFGDLVIGPKSSKLLNNKDFKVFERGDLFE